MSRSLKFAGNEITVSPEAVSIGSKASDFSVLKSDLTEVKLSDYNDMNVVLVVFPSIDTGVCAMQTRKFNELAASMKDTMVLTISCDLPFALGRFCGAEGIENVVTTSDHRNLDFGTKYGFILDDLRLLARGTVIIDKNGIIKFVEYVDEVTNEPDYDAAIEILNSL